MPTNTGGITAGSTGAHMATNEKPKKRPNGTRKITPEHRAKMQANAAKARAARSSGLDVGDIGDWASVWGYDGHVLRLPKGELVRL